MARNELSCRPYAKKEDASIENLVSVQIPCIFIVIYSHLFITNTSADYVSVNFRTNQILTELLS